MTNEGRKINIFWTGGLDSTFRIVELSQCRCTIQPYYIVFKKRRSLRYELKAIKTISRILRKDKRTKAKLLDPIIVEGDEIGRDTITFDSWLRLMRAMCWQYYLLAKYANLHHLEMEMGIQFSPNGFVARSIDETLLIPHPDSNYNVQIIDKTRADKDTLQVFGNFCFPKTLYHKDKKEEVEILRRDGYEKVLKHIWFCFHPIMGFPCGHCGPCISYEKEGVELPRIGKQLYAINLLFKKKKNRRVFKLKYDFTIHEVSDVFVAKVKDPETGQVKKLFRLNETGVIIIEALQDSLGIDEIARRLTEGFDVDFETAKREASAFIAKLKL